MTRLPDSQRSERVRITKDCVLTDQVSAALYRIYTSAFDPLRTLAAARHMLSVEEFMVEMKDPRIDKYIVWGGDDAPIAMSTLTSDLSAIPWVSKEYYASKYPDAAAAGLLFYLGFILVESPYRRSNAVRMMTDQINRRLSEAEGVLGFDLCGYNDASGIGRYTKSLFASSNALKSLDVQTYYGADYRGITVPAEDAPAI